MSAAIQTSKLWPGALFRVCSMQEEACAGKGSEQFLFRLLEAKKHNSNRQEVDFWGTLAGDPA